MTKPWERSWAAEPADAAPESPAPAAKPWERNWSAPPQAAAPEPAEAGGFYVPEPDFVVHQPGLLSRIRSGFREGLDLSGQGLATTAAQLRGADPEEMSRLIAEHNTRETRQSEDVQGIQTRIHEAAEPYQGAWGRGDHLESLKGTFKTLWATGKEFAKDPVSFAEFSAQAMGTSVMPIAGMVIGAIWGSKVPVVGTAAGSIAGGFSGSAVLEFGLWMQEAVTEKVVDAGGDPSSPADVHKVLSDPDVRAEIEKEAAIKGLSHAAIGAVVDRLSVGVLRVKPTTTAGKVGQKGVAGTMQVVSEGLEEGGSQVLATGDYDVADVALEMAGGLGAGVAQTIILDLAKGGAAVVPPLRSKGGGPHRDDPTPPPDDPTSQEDAPLDAEKILGAVEEEPTAPPETPAAPLTTEPGESPVSASGPVELARPVEESAPQDILSAEPEPAPAPAPTTPAAPVKQTRQQRMKQDRTIQADQDDLLAAIAKAGGLNREEAEAQGIDPAEFNRRGYKIARVFTKKGMNFDAMAEALSQHGYPVLDEAGNYNPNTLLDALNNALAGNRVFTPQGYENWIAKQQADQEQAQADVQGEPAPEGFGEFLTDPQELDDLAAVFDENDAYTDSVASLAELKLRAEAALGEDEVEAILERVAAQTEGQPGEAFAQALEDAIQEAIDARTSERDAAGEPDGGRLQGAAPPAPAAGPAIIQPGPGLDAGIQPGGPAAPVPFSLERPVAPPPAAPAPPPAQDMFGPAPVAEQAMFDAKNVVEQALSGEDVPAGAGPGDLFSGKAKQVDIADAQEPGTQGSDRRRKKKPGLKEDKRTGQDRRKDPEARKRVDDMSPAEMRQALLVDDLTGLGNRRAYNESEKMPIQVSIDLDGLKFVNDEYGHPAGDKLIAAFGEVVGEFVGDGTAEGYHISGDEFIVQAFNESAARRVMKAISERANDVEIEVELQDTGEARTITSIGFGYGIGQDLKEAERKLKADKEERKRQGLRRDRGDDEPGGKAEGTAAAQDQGRAPAAEVDAAAHEAATSPENGLPEPTDAQKEAGNYKKGHVTIQGLDISIENPAGSLRRPEWPALTAHYGYIKGTVGKDKDHIDVFLGENAEQAGTLFVIDQIDPKTGKFDEHKVIIGPYSEEEAVGLYQSNYEKGWQGAGAITHMDFAEFKEWLQGDTTKPVKLKQHPGKKPAPRKKRLLTQKSSGTVPAMTTEQGSGDNLTDTQPLEPESEEFASDLSAARAFVSKIESLAEKHGKVYIRWSPTSERDLSGDQRSRDFVAGTMHNGLSAVEVDSNTHPVDIAKALSEYMFARMQDPRSVPRVYAADRVGTDSDTHALIKPKELLAEAGSDVMRAIDFQFADILELEDNIALGEERLGRITDAAGKKIVEEGVAKSRARLAKLLNPNPSQRSQGAGSSHSKTAEPQADKLLGKNADGETLYEDKNGVRYILSGGIQISQTVELRPTRSGMQMVPVTDERFEVAPKAKPTPSKNTIFTDDAADKARAILKAKLGQMNAGIDPEIMQAGITLAGHHIEKGARTFAAYAKAMVDDLGDLVKPYLKSWYMGVKYDPRAADLEGMDDAATVDKADLNTILAADEDPVIERRPQGNGTEFHIIKTAAGYNVGMFDSDIGKYLPTLRQYKGEDALAKAREYLNSIDKTAQTSPEAGGMALAKVVEGWLEQGALTIDWRTFFKEADKAYGGTQADGAYSPKQAYDAMELGLNQYIAKHPELFSPNADIEEARKIIEHLESLARSLPTQTRRSQEQQDLQQFSTPPMHAYVAAWVARISGQDTVVEPSAGTGNLVAQALNAGARAVYANELSEGRADLLESMGAERVTRENASHLNSVLPAEIKPTVVLMNPPFSADSNIPGKKNTGIGAKHVEEALKRLQPDGRLVAILGRGMALDKPAFKAWWKGIKGKYNVRANIGISGQEYTKFGTSFDNVMVVIDKTGPTIRQPVIGNVEKVQDLLDLLQEIRDDRAAAAEQPSAESGRAPGARRPGTQAGSRVPVQPAADAGRPESGDLFAPSTEQKRPDRDGGRAPVGKTGQRDAVPAGDGPARGGNRPRGATGPGAGGTVAGAPAGTADQGSRDVAAVSKAKKDKAGKLTDSTFEHYQPNLRIEGAQPHPTKLAESAAMASVEMPDIDYQPSIPAKIITSGKLSEVQLEAISYAGAAHQQKLESGARRGFYIGDGTGVGKGAQVAGIILDNWNQGRRKAVWVSENVKLAADAERDLTWIGMDAKKVLVKHPDIKAGQPIKNGEGVMFTTYSTLASAIKETKDADGTITKQATRRIDQLVEWLGEDFDGVIAFDEAHNMGNAVDQKGTRGIKKASAKALSGIELQQRLPNARVVYVSATAATEVSNLAYADRLGLWGPGTAFPDKSTFISEISAGGVAAMEVVAKDMKAMGLYVARSLSFEDVTYDMLEQTLTEPQRDIYNTLATAWQGVLQNVNEALIDNNSDRSGGAKSAAYSAFWGSHQRFFNQVMTAMQAPAIIRDVEQQLDTGNSAVLQLVNTNEAVQERRMAQAAAADIPLEEVDITPRDILMQYVSRSFPTTLYEEYTDDEGNARTRQVVDSEGNPVQNPDSLRRRDELLEKLASIDVPEGILEQLFNHFGSDAIAEITGRSRRLVRQKDGRVVEERLGVAKSNTDARAFMDGKKRILVFSDAGGTGRSYHADLRAKNQQKRIHYLVQPGWRADKAVQGFGRTHRTNQAQAPQYKLVTTNLKAQRRFLSSIARRLDQLGALSKGQRDTANQGMFTSDMNLENQYADMALQTLVEDLYKNQAPGLSLNVLEDQMGISVRDSEGNLKQDINLSVPKFLNRLLSLNIEEMDQVFDAFFERLKANIEYAKQTGTFDVGMETIGAESVEKVEETDIQGQEGGRGTTKYVKLALTDPVRFTQFDALPLDAKGLVFARNKRSGKLYALVPAMSATDSKTGAKIERLRRIGVASAEHIEKADVTDKYEIVNESDHQIRAAWDEEISNSPPNHTREVHMISGALLPVWDRLPTSASTKILRAQTDSGERVIGRSIPARSVPETLKRLGVAVKIPDLTPRQFIDNVLNRGDEIELANGWKLTSKMVSGQKRIEVTGYDYADQKALKDYGGFVEIIAYKGRIFLPVDKAPEILANIIKSKPIVEVTPGGGEARFSRTGPASAGFSVSGVEQAISRAVLGWNQEVAPQVTVVQSVNDLPEAAREGIDLGNPPAGVALPGQVFLIADHIRSDQHARTVLTHEGIGHYAVDQIMESQDWGAMKRQLHWMKQAGNKRILELLNEVHRHYAADIAADPDVELAELIAIAAERRVSEGLAGKLLRKMRELLRAFFKRLGMNQVLADADIDTMITRAARFMRTGKNGRGGVGGVGPMFSRSDETKAAYEQRIDELFSGGAAEPVGIRALDRSDILDMMGYGNMPVHVAEGKLKSGQFNHALTAEHWKKIPEWLDSPVAVFDSDTVDGRLVFLAPETVSGKPVVMILQPDTKAGRLDAHLLVNAYERGSPIPLRRWLEDGLLRYLDQKKSPAFGTTTGLRLPRVVHQPRGSREKVYTNKDLVKYRQAEGGPKFSRRQPDDDVQQAQAKMNSDLNAGQPLDKVFRAVFKILHVDTATKAIYEKGVHYLTEAKLPTDKETGLFSWMNGVMEHARAGLIDRYGLPESYVHRDFQREADKRNIELKTLDFLQAIQDRGVTDPAEAAVLQAVLTGEQVPEGKWAELAAPIREAIDELGQEAMELGLITREAYDRNKGSYLHRVYLKHEGRQNALGKWVANVSATRRKRIRGDELKGRGMTLGVSMDKLLALTPADWWGRKEKVGQADKALHQAEFIVFDRLAHTGEGTETIDGMEQKQRGKLKERIYWPADVPVPAKYEAWENRGRWQVRDVKGGKAMLWRDFTKQERMDMGEMLDARYTITKTFMLMAHDLSTGRFLKDIADNPEWSRKEEPENWSDPKGAMSTYANVEWVRVPTDMVGKTNVAKWGALAGRFVRAEIWRDLNELDRMQMPGFWRTVMTQWKLNKTARNPVVHMNNVMSNLLFMDMADIRWRDLKRALASYIEKDEHYRDAMQNGAFGASYVEHEIRRDILDPILQELMQQDKALQTGAVEGYLKGNEWTAKMAVLGRMADQVGKKAVELDKKMTDIYQFEDEIFRLATYLRRVARGDDKETAARIARDQFLNYDIRAPWVNAARRTLLPFISYTYRAVPVIAKSLAERPWKIAKYTTVAYAMNALAYALAPGDDDEDKERRSMRDEVQGHTWLGTPRMIRMPYLDEWGNPVFLDIRRWIPAGDVFDMNQGQMPLPAWMQFGGPLMLAGEFALNKQAFTGGEIVNDLTDTAGDKAKKYAGWAWRSWMPSAPWIPGSWYWDKIGRSITGGRDMLGREYDLPTAAASSVGIKLQAHDVDLGMQFKAREYQNVARALQAEMRLLENDRRRRLVREDEYAKQRASIQRKMENLQERAAETFKD